MTLLTNHPNTTISTFIDLHHVEQKLVAATLGVFLIMGFFGNSFILLLIRNFRPSHQYRPGRLLLIWMFGTDLALTVLMVLPATLTAFGWTALIPGMPSGSVLCNVFGFTETIFAAHENLIILLMSIERVFTIYFPLRKILNVRRTNCLCVFCFIMAIILATINFLINSFVYNPDALRCLADFYPAERAVQLFISGSTIVYVLIPLLTTIVVYVLIIRIVYRSRRSGTNWQAIKTTLVVVGVYLFAVLPFIFSRLYTNRTGKHMPLRFRIFCTVVYMLNTAINPYVYLLTNRSLRNHSTQLFKSKPTETQDFNGEGLQNHQITKIMTRMESHVKLKLQTINTFQLHNHGRVIRNNIVQIEEEVCEEVDAETQEECVDNQNQVVECVEGPEQCTDM